MDKGWHRPPFTTQGGRRRHVSSFNAQNPYITVNVIPFAQILISLMRPPFFIRTSLPVGVWCILAEISDFSTQFVVSHL